MTSLPTALAEVAERVRYARTDVRIRKALPILGRLRRDDIDVADLARLARLYGWRAHVTGGATHAIVTDIRRMRAHRLAELLRDTYQVRVRTSGNRVDVSVYPTQGRTRGMATKDGPYTQVRVWHNATLDDLECPDHSRSYQPHHRMVKVFHCVLTAAAAGRGRHETAEMVLLLINHGPGAFREPMRSVAADYWDRALRMLAPGDVVSLDDDHLTYHGPAGFRHLDNALVTDAPHRRTRPESTG